MYYDYFNQVQMWNQIREYHEENLKKLEEKPRDMIWYSAFQEDQRRREEALKNYYSLPWYKRIFRIKPF
jgi:hypothetical protein